MKYNQRRLDRLIDKVGMKTELAALQESGATYEMFAEAVNEALRTESSSRAIRRSPDMFCLYNGILTDQELTVKQVGDICGIEKDQARYAIQKAEEQVRTEEVLRVIYEKTLQKIEQKKSQSS